jgi:N-acetylmuramic acid 6-phosphate (MurNAc-6-P) etherase
VTQPADEIERLRIDLEISTELLAMAQAKMASFRAAIFLARNQIAEARDVLVDSVSLGGKLDLSGPGEAGLMKKYDDILAALDRVIAG